MFQAFILGFVQAFGEFLPISSSAHLVILPWLFGWRDQGLSFDIGLHWGTLLAVVGYFRLDVWRLLQAAYRSLLPASRNFRHDIDQGLSWYLLFSSIPAAVVGVYMKDTVEFLFRNPLLIAATLASFGLLLLFAERISKQTQSLSQLTLPQALCIGFAQALALVPGVSRSGVTMTAGLLLGLERMAAARFSFLLSIPITFGAGLLTLDQLYGQMQTGQFWVGFITSAVVGVFAIRFLLAVVARRGFDLFVWYRLCLALLIVVLYAIR